MIARLTSAVGESYRIVPTLIAAAPLFFLAPIAAEAVQHAIEWSIGMFSESGTMRSAARDGRRTLAGVLKVSTLVIVGVLVARYWAQGGDLRRALRLDARERRFLFSGVAIAGLVLGLLVFSPGLLSGVALPEKMRRFAPLLLVVLAAAVFQRRSVWAVAGLLGDRRMTVERAAALSSGRPARFTTVALVATIAPPMALHYALNFAARGLGPALLAFVLLVDSILVGATAILIGNVIWISYRDAQEVDAPTSAESHVRLL
ncbi:MAG TPA: hypothetical protein VK993_08050 [Chthoniobacterales bacterium]|nr:hypothetical protein [Chthoniobacterales bacterium]